MHIRLRIQRDRSHRDDDAMIVPVIVPGTKWSCLACGFHDNDEDEDRFCGWCKSERGDWLCERCGHKNPKREDDCEGCGHPRPEDDE